MIGFITRDNKTENAIRKIFMAIILLGILLILVAPIARADYEAYTYTIDAGTRRIIEWNAAPGADGYEIVVRRMKSGKALYSGTVTGTSIGIRFNTIGLNVVYLRAFKGTGAAREYGEWKNSLDQSFAVVNSVPRAWVLAVQNYN